MLSDTEYRLLVLTKISGIGRKSINSLISNGVFFRSKIEELAHYNPQLEALLTPQKIAVAQRKADEEIDLAQERGERIVTQLNQSDYPQSLFVTDDKPTILYVRGDMRSIKLKSVCIIGTRHPTDIGALSAERIARYFAKKGWCIVSGLALGTDSIAHKASVSLKSPTIAVLAHGLDDIAPKSNADLANRMIESGGALVTEYSYGVKPFPGQFVERDRIQACMAAGTIMVQSGINGGSLHATRATAALKRPIAVPIALAPDKAAGATAVSANIVFTEGTYLEKAELLKADLEAAKTIFVIRSRDDYPVFEESLENSRQQIAMKYKMVIDINKRPAPYASL